MRDEFFLPKMSGSEEDRTLRLLLQRQSTWSRYGNRRVFCGGCVIIGPIRSWWWLLEAWTIFVAAIFASEYEEYHIAVLIAGLVLFVICMSSCFAINFGDPGILPKPLFSDAYRNAQEVSVMVKNGVHSPYRNVTVGDKVLKYTYCMRCHHFRPPDTGHCYTCDSCIEHWDHHCPIFGGCVGRRNFIAFHVMCLSQATIWVFWLTSSAFATATVAKDQVTTEQIFLRCKTLMCVIIGFLGAAILPFFLSKSRCEKNNCEPKPKAASISSSKESSSLCKKLRVFPHDKLEANNMAAQKISSGGDWASGIVPDVEIKDYLSVSQSHKSSTSATNTYYTGDFTSSDTEVLSEKSEKRWTPRRTTQHHQEK